jgi:hypothetical protein
VGHRTVSGAPPDIVRCTRELHSELRTFGNSQSRGAIIHRTVRCTRTVSGAPRGRGSELGRLGNSHLLLRYNSPDMSGVHRTVRCNCRATTTSGANGYLQHIKCAPARAEVRHAHAGAPDTLQFMSGAPPDIQAGPASELQRSEP